jgi:hypothetical protein
MAGVNRSNVAVTDTFDTWRIRTNEVNTTLNQATEDITANTIVLRDDNSNYTANQASLNTISVIHGTSTSAVVVTSALAADSTKASIYTTGGVKALQKSIFSADVDISEDLVVSGNTTLGSSSSDEFTVTATLSSNVIPTSNNTNHLGTTIKQYAETHFQKQTMIGSGTESTNTLGITTTAATNTSVSMTNNALTSGSLLQISSSSTDATARDLVKFHQSADTSGAAGLTVLNLTHASGRGIYIDSTDASGDAKYSLEINADQATTNAITINAASTTATSEFHSFPALTTGTGMFITSSSNNLSTAGAVVEINQSGSTMSAANAAVLSVIQAGSGTYGVKIDTNHATANSSLRVESVATTKNIVEIAPSALTTGDAFNITTAEASVHTGQLISLTSANTNNTARGEALKIQYQTANATAVAVRVANSSADIFTVEQSGDTVVGRDLSIGGNLSVQGTTTQINTTTTLARDTAMVLGAQSAVVTGATYTAANPAVVTSTGHTLENGEVIFVVASTGTAIVSEQLVKVSANGTNVFTAQTIAGANITGVGDSTTRTFSWVGPQTDAATDDAGLIIPGDTAIHSLTWDNTDNYWKLNDSTKIDSTGQFVIPVGTTAQRPSSSATGTVPAATIGAMRFNSTDTKFEFVTSGTSWEHFAAESFSVAMAIALG